MLKRFIITLVLLVISTSAWAFWPDGTISSVRQSSGTTLTMTSPTGGPFNTGDVVLLVCASTAPTTDMTITDTGEHNSWVIFGSGAVDWTTGTGLVTPSGGHNLGWTTGGKLMVATLVYTAGDPLTPTINNLGGTTRCIEQPFYGVDTTTPISSGAGTAAASQTAFSFPSLAATNANQELLNIGFLKGSTYTFPAQGSNQTITTCSTTTIPSILFSNVGQSGPTLFAEQANQGPCAAGSTTAFTQSYGATAADEISVSLLLKSTAVKPLSLSSSAPVLNNRGAFYLHNLNSPPTVWDQAVESRAGTLFTGMTIQGSWDIVEDAGCDIFSWDQLDNYLLNAGIDGEHVHLMLGNGYYNLCGGANMPSSCSGLNPDVATPAWVNGSTTCTNSGTPGHIHSIWIKTSRGVPAGSDYYIFDPNDAHYKFALDRFYGNLSSRYGSITNITAVTALAGEKSGVEMNMQNGADGTAVALTSGTAQQDHDISGLADWASGHNYSVGNQIFPVLNNGSNATAYYFQVTSCAGTCTSGSTEPTWTSCSTTCTDGTVPNQVTWTNKGNYSRTIADVSQWSGLGYDTTHGDCNGTHNTLCYGVVSAEEAIETTVASDFPNAEIVQPLTQGGPFNSSYPTGAQSADYVTAIFAHDAATYPGKFREQNNAIGLGGTGQIFIASNGALVNQPAEQVGWQETGAQNNAGNGTTPCNASPPYSINQTDCVPPEVYAAMANSMDPYVEFYVNSIDDAKGQPWILMFNQFANQFRGGGYAATHRFSSQPGNAAARPGTFEPGAP